MREVPTLAGNVARYDDKGVEYTSTSRFGITLHFVVFLG